MFRLYYWRLEEHPSWRKKEKILHDANLITLFTICGLTEFIIDKVIRVRIASSRRARQADGDGAQTGAHHGVGVCRFRRTPVKTEDILTLVLLSPDS